MGGPVPLTEYETSPARVATDGIIVLFSKNDWNWIARGRQVQI